MAALIAAVEFARIIALHCSIARHRRDLDDLFGEESKKETTSESKSIVP